MLRLRSIKCLGKAKPLNAKFLSSAKAEELSLLELVKERGFKEKKKPVQHERRLQIQCVTWFKLQFPKVKILHIKNGGSLGGLKPKFQGQRFKEMGVLKGVLDLFIPACFFWIEIKWETLKLEPEQEEFQSYVKDCDYETAVVNNFEMFQEVALKRSKFFKQPLTLRNWLADSKPVCGQEKESASPVFSTNKL